MGELAGAAGPASRRAPRPPRRARFRTWLTTAMPAEPGDDDRDRRGAHRPDRDARREQRAHQHLRDDEDHDSASSTGTSEPTRKVSDCVRDAAASQRTSTIVWIAIPPIRLPAASERWPLAAAETVIATSGSVPAIASRMTPPSASPRSKRRSIASVDLESAVPAIQVAAAAAPRGRRRERSSRGSRSAHCSGWLRRWAGAARGSAAGRRPGSCPRRLRRRRTGGSSAGSRDRSRRRRSEPRTSRRPGSGSTCCEPHAEQNTLAKPSGGSHAREQLLARDDPERARRETRLDRGGRAGAPLAAGAVAPARTLRAARSPRSAHRRSCSHRSAGTPWREV